MVTAIRNVVFMPAVIVCAAALAAAPAAGGKQ